MFVIGAVDCLGTENRRSGSEAISASDCTYEFIIFRAVNIKSLRLEEGDRRDLTREILEPLRQAGQETNSKRQSRSAEDTKRRVGYDPVKQLLLFYLFYIYVFYFFAFVFLSHCAVIQ